ncbi:HEAT repeat domain-containing protein [Endomicrobium proavitum]|uniref:HEAT repeat domain-containing protein n=1 Tax=Endomicrobium proavitum TaxID=1408281 RepID=A0A0G3WJP6_9BACT|nr:HEAT repeat domain-containing protein [Endomicrobium proavitum]AKL98508.1 exported protein of unknown function [Endomicrobium proavitum]
MKKFHVFALGMFLAAAATGCATTSGEDAGSVAANTIGSMAAGSETVNILIGKLNSDSALVRLGAIQAIGKLGSNGAQAVPAIIPFLSSADANVRANAAFALGQIGPKASAATPQLIQLISDKNSKVQRNAVEAIANIGGANVPSLLIPLLIDINPTVQTSAMELLGKFGTQSKSAIPQLISLAKGNKNLRQLALDTLVQIGPDSITSLTALLTSGDTDLISKATAALALLKK